LDLDAVWGGAVMALVKVWVIKSCMTVSLHVASKMRKHISFLSRSKRILLLCFCMIQASVFGRTLMRSFVDSLCVRAWCLIIDATNTARSVNRAIVFNDQSSCTEITDIDRCLAVISTLEPRQLLSEQLAYLSKKVTLLVFYKYCIDSSALLSLDEPY